MTEGKKADRRIVEMTFDNQQFERGVSTTTNSLKKLKEGLDLSASTRNLSELNRVGRTFSLEGIGRGVDELANRFSALGIAGMTVIQNLTNAALNAGINMVKSLTLDPIKMGLDEYETKMNAITTILTNTKSKGTTITDVNKALAELNDYADQTIYNFSEMTKNIGTFTAAGIDLDKSTMAIKGIANLAAGSGSSALQASTAMYQLSQALAAGSVKLIDWNSVVNAGMGGELFQNALKGTAKEMGVVVDASVPFRQTLESGWLTADVLIKTLEKFSKDKTLLEAATQVKTFTQLLSTMKESVQSGWAVSWESIIGNKDQAAKTLTAVNDAFGAMMKPMTDARNKALAFWNTYGGRTALIGAISNAFKLLGRILKPIGKAFKEVFPATTGMQLLVLSQRIQSFTEKLKIGGETAENIKRTFKGLFAILDIAKMGITALVRGLASLFATIFPVTGSFLKFTGTLGDYVVAIDKALKSSDAFNETMDNILKILKPLAKGIQKTFGVIIDAFAELGSISSSGMGELSERMKIRFEPLTKLGEVLKGLIKLFYDLASIFSGFFGNLMDSIINSFGTPKFNSLLDTLNSGLFATILYGLKKFIDSMTSMTNNVTGVVKQFTGILDGVRGSLQAYQSSLKANVLLKIAAAMGMLAASLFTISLIDSDKLTASLAAMTAMFVELFGSMAVFTSITGVAGFLVITKLTTGMIGLSAAILILSNAMQNLSELDWEQLARGLTAVAVLSGVLIASARLMPKSSGLLIKSALGLILFAAAINVLVKAVEKLGKLDTKKLTKGLIGVGVLMAELVVFMKLADLSKVGLINTVGIIALAAALAVLTYSVEKMGKLKTDNLIKGLSTIGILLAEIVMFTKIMGNPKGLISTAIAIGILGAAILLLSEGIIRLGKLSWDKLTRGLTGMAGGLLMVVVAMNTLPKNMFLKSLALLDVAGALLILAQALTMLSKLSWDQIARSMVALGGSLLLIVGMFMALNKSDLVDSTAFLILSVGITLLARALKTLGSMSLTQIGLALLALAGTFAIMGAAALLLTPVIPAIFALAGAMVLLGVGTLAFGLGVSAVAAGLVALSAAGAGAAVAMTAMLTSIIGLIPYLFKTVAKGIVEIAKVIGDGAPIIVAAIVKVLSAMLDGMTTIIPKAVDTFYQLLTALLETVVKYIPRIVNAGMKILIGFLQGIADNIFEVVTVAIQIVLNFIAGISSMLPKIIQAGFNLILSFINGLANAIRTNTPLLIDAIDNLMRAMIDAAVAFLTHGAVTNFTDAGSKVIRGFIKGMENKISEVGKTASRIATSVLNAAKRVLGIHSPSRAFEDVGMRSDEGFARGLTRFASVVKTSAKGVGETAMSALTGAVSNISGIISGDIDANPTIRPVLDLSDVKTGATTISSLLGQNQDIAVRSASIARNIQLTGGNDMGLGKTVQKALTDLKTAVNNSQQTVSHTGEITVKGVNDMNQVVGVTKILAQEIAYGNRRIPVRVATIPSLA